MRKTVSVIGSGQNATPSQKRIAYELGKLIAKKGLVLLCGGREGVMDSASRGAHEAGGIVVGILPGDTKDGANNYVDIAIATGIGFARNQIISYSGDVIIAVGGEAGTLTEMAFAWAKGKPIIAISTSGGAASNYAGKKMDSRNHPKIISAKDAKAAMRITEKILEK